MTPVFRQNARRFALLATLVAGSAVSASGGSAAPSRAEVSLVGYSSRAALRAAVARSHATVLRRLPALHIAVLRTPPAAAGALDGARGIRYAEEAVPRYRLAEPALAPAAVPGGAYEWQYAATHEDLVPASVKTAASKVTVAVLDSGADVTAPDIAAKAAHTWSIVTNSADTTDTVGHGTFVASLAAGASGNDEGIAGFGGEAGLLVVKAGESELTSLDVAEAIVYAVDHGANVVNMSFGGPDQSSTELAAVNYAASHGVLLVAAAGNDGQSGNEPMYPAAYLQPLGSNGQGGLGLSVGASDVASARAAFSNYGSYISLAAPGADVFGAVSSDADPGDWPPVALPGSFTGLYGYASGTSFAAPEVAGAAALVWAANNLLSAADVAAVLKETASGNGSWNQELGYGILDVGAAVARAQSIVVQPPTVELSGTLTGRRVELSWRSTSAASYRLEVRRDGGAARVLLGASTSTGTSALLDPGHTYSFAVTATTRYGVTFSSPPYVVTLPFSPVQLLLHVSTFTVGARKGATVGLAATFVPRDVRVARGSKLIALESFNGRSWRRFARVRTNGKGVATWTGRLRNGAYRLRARYAGAYDLGAATSAAVRLRVG